RVTRLVDRQLASGTSPEATAESFRSQWAAVLNVDPSQFLARGPFADGHNVQEMMHDLATGEPKFTGVYYTQTADGVPVYGTRLMVLVRNVDGFPAVSATADLRDITGFKAPRNLAVNDAMALVAAAQRLGRGVLIDEPELFVWAGTEEQQVEPRLALVFDAWIGGGWDLANYQRLQLFVDARNGTILHEENRILHADITGNVGGMATEGSGADVCENESHAGLPYATVSGGGASTYADASGDYVLSISGSSATVTSGLNGHYFNVNNQAGGDSTLSQNVSAPGMANFVHNSANSSEYYRAEVNAYLHANIVRDFVLDYNPSYPQIANETSFPVNVNISDTCNAYYDYSSINFYSAGGGCSNTAFSVVVHHEYGHHLVATGGSGQGAYGEGMGDVMGVLITGDAELARGFFSDDCNNGIRTADNSHQYPCSGGIHDCGQLISGCVWDTRQALMATEPTDYSDIISNLAVNSILMHSGTSIDPTITLDFLTLDDDDGDLDNGTPHYDEIIAGFGAHNMDEIPEPLDNDFCSTAREVTDGDWSFTTVGALSDGDAYSDAQCSGTYLGEMYADVWFSYTACDTGSMVVSTCDLVTFDSDIVIYQGDCDNKTQIGCNGDGADCGGYTSYATANVVDGEHYLIRVGGWDGSASGSGVLRVDGPGEPCEAGPSVNIGYPDGRPDLLDPNGGTEVAISVSADTADPAPNTGMLHYNGGSGWSEMAMGSTSQGYLAVFPAFNCGASVDWYVSVDDTEGNNHTSPSSAPGTSWNALAYSGFDVVFDDDFQTDQGWSVSGNATDGQWDRGVPAGFGDRCDPPTDADGSGMCYVTDNVDGNSDVDGGTTILTSPLMDASDGPVLKYWRWYSNGSDCAGGDPQNDIFDVDISDDGGATWMTLETVGPTGSEVSGGWYYKEFDLSEVSGFEPSDAFRVRFVASDLGDGSVIEAGVDGVELSRAYCDDAGCDEDVNGDGMIDVSDLLAIVSAWGGTGGPEDVNGDGMIDVSDLLAIMSAWGSCEG
ncbi:MAG: hypothetical protein QGH76_05850, partial [Phycisphaerales bacterium]|nr:hypothetical protein [Phycisphaerales bacterium]